MDHVPQLIDISKLDDAAFLVILKLSASGETFDAAEQRLIGGEAWIRGLLAIAPEHEDAWAALDRAGESA